MLFRSGGGWQNTHTVYWEYQGKIQNQDGGSHSGSGVVGGGQVGCDYQMGTWVLGLHGMFDWANMKGSNIYPGNSPETLTTKAKWFGTLTGRFGYTVESNTLAYVKGGAAWIRNDYQDVYASAYDGRASETLSGWTIGGGLEHMLHHNWSVFAEYNYASFEIGRAHV